MKVRKFEFPISVQKAYIGDDGLKHVIAVASDNKLDLYQEYFALSALEDMVNAANSTKPNKPSEGLVDLMETHYETFSFGYAVKGWLNRNPIKETFEFWVDFALRKNAWQGDLLYEEVKNGENVKQLSVGGYIEDDDDIVFETEEFEDDEGNTIEMTVVRLEHIVLEHVATTPEGWAANPRTRFEDVGKSTHMIKNIYKSLGDDGMQRQIQENLIMVQKGAVPKHSTPVSDKTSWDADAAVSKIRKWASSDGSGDKDTISWSKYRKAFGWYDSDDQENYGAYKLPHHTVENDKLVLVESGLTAAMAALNGARGGVDIPDDDRQSVYNHLKNHYSDIDEEPPELKSIELDDKPGVSFSSISLALKQVVKQAITEVFGERKNMDIEKAREELDALKEKYDEETLKALGLVEDEDEGDEGEGGDDEETPDEEEEPDVPVEKQIEEALSPISEKLKSLPESYLDEEKVSELMDEKFKSLKEEIDSLKTELESKEEALTELKSTVDSLSPGSHDEEGETGDDDEDVDEDDEDDLSDFDPKRDKDEVW